MQAFPAGAIHEGVGRIQCAPDAKGDLRGCVIAGEEPANEGFGQAALSLAAKFRMTKDAAKSHAEGVIVPIRFTPPEVARPWREPAFKSNAGYTQLGPAGPYFPDYAYRKGVSGEVVMDCAVKPDAGLEGCRLVSVTPDGFGFQDAVAAMIRRNYLTGGPPPSGAAAPPDGVWRFRIPFILRR